MEISVVDRNIRDDRTSSTIRSNIYLYYFQQLKDFLTQPDVIFCIIDATCIKPACHGHTIIFF